MMDPAMLDEIRDVPASALEPFPTAGRAFLVDRLFGAKRASAVAPAASSIAAPAAPAAPRETDR